MNEFERPFFEGFSMALPEVLGALADNNSKEWFRAHKADYDRHVAGPLAALAEDVAAAVARIDNRLVKKLSRPNRDTRFSANKAPYRSEAWFAFCRQAPEWTDWPAFYFEVKPAQCRWGMGFYSARSATMGALRGLVAAQAKEFTAALIKAQERRFAIEGELYRRLRPVHEGTPKKLAEFHQRRNCYMEQSMPYSPDLQRREFALSLIKDFEALAPLYRLFSLALAQSALR